ncbi:MAG: response regulator [Nitrospirae bacterium]|nr:response regulator [Nitrospirota bacterium]
MGKKILVIDDEPDMRLLIERVLSRKGFDITTVAYAPDAVNLVEKDSFFLLITDLTMPEMNGLDLIKQVRQAGFNGKFIIITGLPTDDAMRDAREQGASDFLIKPLNMHDLENAVSRAICSID